MIDPDSQCNLTRTFFTPETTRNTPASVLSDHQGDQLPLGAAIYETHIENLDPAASPIHLERPEKSGRVSEYSATGINET